jgi:putative ABC transport system ATP-binding protein
MMTTGVPRAERKQKALGLLETVGLSARGQHRPDELSAGEQQRVAIARALANGPAIILADEPTGNLDTENGLRIMNLLGQLNSGLGTTIVMVTHDDRMARLAKRRLHLKDGQIVGAS